MCVSGCVHGCVIVSVFGGHFGGKAERLVDPLEEETLVKQEAKVNAQIARHQLSAKQNRQSKRKRKRITTNRIESYRMKTIMK